MEIAPIVGIMAGVMWGIMAGIIAGAMAGRIMGIMAGIRPGGAAVNVDDEDTTTPATGASISQRGKWKDTIDASSQAKEGRPQGEGAAD
jgi:hypothetical protein